MSKPCDKGPSQSPCGTGFQPVESGEGRTHPKAPSSAARIRALGVLMECSHGTRFAHQLLAELQDAEPLPRADAALAEELTLGVLRHRITCEHLASRFHRGRWAGLSPRLRMIIALGVYQLCWLERIPDHAAVDQSVKQARRLGRHAAALVNALLRRVAECRGDVIPRPVDPDPRRYLAIDPSRGRLFSENVFPDPTRRPLDYLVAATSHPPWLVERWHRRFKPALCRQVCDAGQRRPPLVLRANRLRVTPDALIERLQRDGRAARFVPGTSAVLVPDAPPVTELAAFRDGLCQPQDAASQAALELSPPRAGEFVVDLCCGSGTKATQAAECMNDHGLVLASDVNDRLLDRVNENARRLGLTCIRTAMADALDQAVADAGRPPDLIIVDAPCTNTGVLARRPEARYRASQRSLASLVEVQCGLLARAASLAGPATQIIYATCSLEPEENEDLVAGFCTGATGWQVERSVCTLPDADCDGGFAALLARRA